MVHQPLVLTSAPKPPGHGVDRLMLQDVVITKILDQPDRLGTV